MKEMLHTISELGEVGLESSLHFHLSVNFYPPLPGVVKEAFVGAFRDYWNGGVTIPELQAKLKDEAGYIGSLGQYDFEQFLNQEDLEG